MGYRLLTATFIAWILSQIIKKIIRNIRAETPFSFFLVSGGGMPSSHSAATMAMTTSFFLYFSVDSFQFAISLLVTCIAIQDATTVRRESGLHAEAINKMLEKKKYNEAIGHSYLQVAIGSVLGIAVALLTKICWP